jgi:hypothetical protein
LGLFAIAHPTKPKHFSLAITPRSDPHRFKQIAMPKSTTTFKLADLLKDSAYKLTPEEIVRQLYVMVLRDDQRRATELLDAAKRAVEIAIEQSEAAALAYLAQVNP